MGWLRRNGQDETSDQALVASFLRRRDEATFRTLYRRHSQGLYSLVGRLVNGRGIDPEEVVQIAWMRAVVGLPEFRWDSTFKTWLTGIALNCVREQLRQARRGEPATAQEMEQVAEPARGLAGEHRLALERAIARLPQGCREVLILHDIEGYTHLEISRFLGIECGTSKSQLWRARQAIRARLEEAERLS